MPAPFSIADLHDAHPDKVHRCSLPFIDYGKKRWFSGSVCTVVTMEDTKLAKSLFKKPGHGRVIVIDGGGSLNTTLLGDIQAGILAKNGWAGIIINGAVRDSAKLAGIELGIKALGTSFVKPQQNGIGAVDVPVAFGHVLFTPGQFVYSDPDGVLVTESEIH